jgi:hypothetical protein
VRWVVGSSPVEGTGQTGGGGDNSEEETSEKRTSQKYSINLFPFLHNLSNDLLLLLLLLLLWICYREFATNTMATACTLNISQMLTCEANSRRINWNCNLNTWRTYVFLSLCSLVFICFFRGAGGSITATLYCEWLLICILYFHKFFQIQVSSIEKSYVLFL